MEIRASKNYPLGLDLTHPISPLAFSLFDSFLQSHCSACFSALSSSLHFPPIPSTFSSNSPHVPSSSSLPLYCSLKCSTAASDLHFSSAEHHLALLLQSRPASWPHGDTSDLRLALCLLLLFERLGLDKRVADSRIAGLMSNREVLLNSENNDILTRIRDGGKAMAIARKIRGGEEYKGEEAVMEELVLCVVITNAVEVQVSGGRILGLAIYDTTFSWINHSCSPNACYRFSLSSISENPSISDESNLLIVPARNCSGPQFENDVSGTVEMEKGWLEYGPRIIVRSIKKIKEGEEVTIAYIDLLQSKGIRQAELWSKYRFICSCRRCSALPPTYVDHALQGTSTVMYGCTNDASDDVAVQSSTDYIDDAISEYLSNGNPESCCEKLESILTQEAPTPIKLQPLHYLSLKAYTVLSSAYRIRGYQLLALDPNSNAHQVESFKMNRTSAAYSLLLAGSAQHLFLSESSLIASLANYWASAGETLVGLVRSSVSNLSSEWASGKRCTCLLLDSFDANLISEKAQIAEFEEISRGFLTCITAILPRVWGFLIRGCAYLETIEQPVAFSGRKGSTSYSYEQENRNQNMSDLFQLGAHCLIYGRYLSIICFGSTSAGLSWNS